MKAQRPLPIPFLLPLVVFALGMAQYLVITPVQDSMLGVQSGYFLGGGGVFMLYLGAFFLYFIRPSSSDPAFTKRLDLAVWSFQYSSVIVLIGASLALATLFSLEPLLFIIPVALLFIQVKVLGQVRGLDGTGFLLLGTVLGFVYALPAACVVWWT